MALGLLRASTSRPCVPSDVSIVGFDDIPEAEFFTPPLTTVRQDFDEMGRQGLHLLLDEISAGGRSTARATVPATLVVRSSTTSAAPASPPAQSLTPRRRRGDRVQRALVPTAPTASTPAPNGLGLAKERMRSAGVPDIGIRAFARLYRLLVEGDRGLLPGDELSPVGDLPNVDELPPERSARDLLDRVVVVKVNGGLGTSMGLSAPKSLIEVKPGLTFLGVIVQSVLEVRRRHDVRMPLVLMNSFATRAATLRALTQAADVRADVPLDFEQHREPRLRAEDLTPIEWPAAPELEWCPPGHGDLYAALLSSGMLYALQEHGYRYAFVSNADNLGAVVEPRILAWMAAEDAPLVMEVVEGTEADRKGGHLARRNGRIVLRETAQTPPSDTSFTDFERWRFYNANNLWLDLDRLAGVLRAADGVLPLPLIVNRKQVDPDDDRSPEVVQLETAMGSAVSAIDGARAVHVPRSRFAPVKTTDDLLCVRSDAYAMTQEGNLAPVRGLRAPPYIDLDPRYFGRLRDFEARFPAGPPSLRRCERLLVHGDVTFGRDVVVVGDVQVTGPTRIPDGAVLEGAGAA